MNNKMKTTILSAVIAMTTMGVFANPVAFGQLEPSAVNPSVNGYNSIAVGANTSVNATNTIVVGRDNTVSGDNTVILGGGNGTTSASQSAILGYNNYIGNHREQTVVGANNTVDNQGATIVGSHSVVRGIDAVVIGNNASAPVQNSVAIGTNSQTYDPVGFGQMDINGTTHVFAGESPNSSVSFGASHSDTYSGLHNYNRQLQNVSAGRIQADSLDAINGSQLYAAIDEINSNGTRITNLNTKVNAIDGRVSANAADIRATEHAVLDHEQRITTLESQSQPLENKINQLERGTHAAIASVSALSALHWNGFDAHNKLSFSAGFGHYKNANAGALGAFYAPNENVMFYVGQSFGSSSVTNASVNFKIGKTTNVKRDEVKDLKERVEMLENLLSK